MPGEERRRRRPWRKNLVKNKCREKGVDLFYVIQTEGRTAISRGRVLGEWGNRKDFEEP